MRLQFRWETYNTFNHTQFDGLDTTARFDPATGAQVNACFGELTGSRTARIMQLGVRFLFQGPWGGLQPAPGFSPVRDEDPALAPVEGDEAAPEVFGLALGWREDRKEQDERPKRHS